MRLLGFLAVLLPFLSAAQADEDRSAMTKAVLDSHILPGFSKLAAQSIALNRAAQTECHTSSEPLQSAYHSAFDAWIAVNHLRFGPTEQNNRAFALAFWPDTRGFTAKSLTKLIISEDPIIATPAAYGSVSIAARGFYALEFLLFDPKISQLGADDYRCALVRAVTADIAATTAQIFADWDQRYADLMRRPGGTGYYKSQDEVLQELFKSLNTGLQLISDARLGRPMGRFDQPRPKRAEAHRSGRSLRHIEISLGALRQLAGLLAAADAPVLAQLETGFERALNITAALEDPIFAGVATPQGRLRVEVLQQAVETISTVATEHLGPSLGVEAGFNALDGD